MAGRVGNVMARPAATVMTLLALPVLGLGAMTGGVGGNAVAAVAVIVVLGVPHGALDVEIGRTLLRPRVGRLWWFPLFGVPYLVVVAAVMTAWQALPEATLAAFLLASVWHFGTEEAGAADLSALVRGGVPVAVPVLVQPDATARVLAAASGLPLYHPPGWLVTASLVWVVLTGVWLCRAPRQVWTWVCLVGTGFALLPPLTAFALYFVGLHAPAHVATLLARHPERVPRVDGAWSAWVHALPTTLLTVAIGTALWLFQPGPAAPERLVGLTLQLLAAFTLPHMLLEAWLDRRDRLDRSIVRSIRLAGSDEDVLAAFTLAAPAHRPVASR